MAAARPFAAAARLLRSAASMSRTTSACPYASAQSRGDRAWRPGRAGAPTKPFGWAPGVSRSAPRWMRYATVWRSPNAAADMTGLKSRSLATETSAPQTSTSSRQHLSVRAFDKRASATTQCRSVWPSAPGASTSTGHRSTSSDRIDAAECGRGRASYRASISSARRRRKLATRASAARADVDSVSRRDGYRRRCGAVVVEGWRASFVEDGRSSAGARRRRFFGAPARASAAVARGDARVTAGGSAWSHVATVAKRPSLGAQCGVT
mmetsp:Transcript_9309/g.38191  ORF Transcript_9309/g.38191 Transcript_9309/m.38191 type:complete len:266 (-) Transcript_9309:213-1010(-)